MHHYAWGALALRQSLYAAMVTMTASVHPVYHRPHCAIHQAGDSVKHSGQAGPEHQSLPPLALGALSVKAR
jgi:hypothetical protein